MDTKIIFVNEYLKLYSSGDGVYLETLKEKTPTSEVFNVLSKHPEIEVTNFKAVKKLVSDAPSAAEKIGKLKERFVVTIYENGLYANITFNVSLQELEMSNRENLKKEVLDKLSSIGIKHGIKNEIFQEKLLPSQIYIIAEGTPAINGKDSVITIYELPNSKPVIREDGSTNFFDLKLISMVESNQWLGERMNATQGNDGLSVKGEIIKASPGKNQPLSYDKNTVYEVAENNKITLYSKIQGAVNYLNGKISVSNHLEVKGDVNFKTGNVKFDGSVTVTGTISPGFSVEATKDIEIRGDLGISNVKQIISTEGSILLKGGISSRGPSTIQAKKNIYTKFVDNSTISCNGNVYIGFACVNSNISCKELIIESTKGKIVGGYIKAKYKVSAPTIGSEVEIRTVIEVTGFNREALIDELSLYSKNLTDLKVKEKLIKQSVNTLLGRNDLNANEVVKVNVESEKLSSIQNEIKETESKVQSLAQHLKTRGSGEVNITKKAFSNSLIIISNHKFEVSSALLATNIFLENNEIKQK